jgi:hypothetical protein
LEDARITPLQTILLHKKEAAVFLLGFLFITALFAFLTLPGGDDWGFFREVVHQILIGKSVYIERYNGSFYVYPPWVAGLLIPLGALPFRWGWGLICSLNFTLAILISRHFKMNLLKQILVLLSPPMLYILLHGQIDVLCLGLLLLPREWWLIGSITKPQVTLGLIFGIPRKDWLKALGIAIGVMTVSLLIFGLWPLEVLRHPKEFAAFSFNIWGGLWPYQILLGIVMVFRAWKQKDDRYLIASSPFFMPYAAYSSLIGPWIALCSTLEDWQAGFILIVWWAVSMSHLL